ncbi:hypothetical protein Tco_1052828 [Tanacetum coccineum]
MIEFNYKSMTYGFVESEKRLEAYNLKEWKHIVLENDKWGNYSSLMGEALFKSAVRLPKFFIHLSSTMDSRLIALISDLCYVCLRVLEFEFVVIMEYLVNISKRHAFWSLNEDILKITVLTTNTLYPSRKIRRQYLKELRDNTFSGSNHEDVNEHIEKVLEIVDLFHIPNITIDQVMLRAFPMSLTGAASRWLRNKPSGLITTWEDLKTKFLSKYCPPARTAKKMEEINNFQQEPDENLYQAWERFKELLMKCP